MNVRSWNTWYGVDLDPQWAVVVRGRGHGRAFRADVLAQGAPDDPRVAAALAEAGAAGAQGRAGVAMAMPGRDGLTRRLTAPMASPAKARRIFPSLLDTLIPMPLESCVSAVTAVRAGRDGRVEALAVAVLQSALQARLAELKPWALDPAVLDFEPLALWAEALTERPAGGPRVVAYAGAQRLVCAAGRAGDFELTLAATPGMAGAPEETVAKVRHFLRAWAGDAASVEWIWVGPGARDAAVTRAFEEALTASPEAPGCRLQFATVAGPEAFLARALARRRGTQGPCAVNVRTGAWTSPAVLARAQAAERAGWMAALLAGALLAGAALTGMAWMRQADAASRKALLEDVRGIVGADALIQPGLEVRAAQRAVEAREQEMRNLFPLFSAVPARALKHAVEASNRHGLHIAQMTISDAAMQVTGTAPDWDVAAQLAADLQGEGWTVDLKREDAGRDERVGFQLGGTRR